MTTLYFVNHVDETIVASKTTLKKAGNPNSKECKELMKLKKLYPTYAVIEKYIKPAEGKNTHKDLTNDLIKRYISIQDDAENLKKQYEEVYKMGKFPLVRKWFLKTFKNFNMDDAKKELDDALFASVNTTTTSTDANQTTTKPSFASTLVAEQALAAD